jgi:hypothetical protein
VKSIYCDNIDTCRITAVLLADDSGVKISPKVLAYETQNHNKQPD